MGRVRVGMKVNAGECWTLFDTGARNSYILAVRVGSMPRWKLRAPEPVALGGRRHMVREECMLVGEVDGHSVRVRARIVDEIGKDEESRPVEVLFGSLAMQEWGIKVDTKNECLDFTHYPTEFIEFWAGNID